MRAAVVALSAAVLGTGCIATGDDSGVVNLYWDFVRNAPAQPGKQVKYDTGLTGTGNGNCAQSGVETITVITVFPQFTVTCVADGFQGVQLILPAGLSPVEIQGFKTDSAGTSVMVYDSTVEIPVSSGDVVTQNVDLAPVTGTIDVFANLVNASSAPPAAFASCDQAGNPTLSYSLFDSAGTLIDQQTAISCPGTTALPLSILGADLNGALDFDTYTIEITGTVGASATPTFDSCPSNASKLVSFDHFTNGQVPPPAPAAPTPGGKVAPLITVNSPPSCTE